MGFLFNGMTILTSIVTLSSGPFGVLEYMMTFYVVKNQEGGVGERGMGMGMGMGMGRSCVNTQTAPPMGMGGYSLIFIIIHYRFCI